MSKSEDVLSLLRDPATGDALRSVLDAASDHNPSSADLAGLTTRLLAVLPPGALPPAAAPPGAAPPAPPAPAAPPVVFAGSAITGKVIMAVVVAGAVGGAAWLAQRGGESATEATTPAPSASAATVPLQASSVLAEVDASPVSSDSAGPSPPHSAHTAAPMTSTPVIPTEPEASMLARAHEALLQGSPDRALAIAGEHARAYPRGSLAQEREVIAIEALVNAGRRDQARARAAAFKTTYPGSSHRARIEQLVEGP